MARDLAAALLVLGALGCAAAAFRASAPRGRAARVLLAGALGIAAAAASDPGADALQAIAAGLAAAGLALIVFERFGGVPALSWLDAVMGASAVGAIALTLGLDAAPATGLGGAVGGLALSRWRPGLGGAHAAAATAGLGFGAAGAVAAAPLAAGAAWRREPRADRGPAFRWTVLAAIIAFATAALALLAVGQFRVVPVPTAVLSIVTFLAGIARAGITVTERLRETERLAGTDELTGLGNRRHLVSGLETAIQRGDPLALLLVDLDGFKELNDTLGHHAGDEVLRQIGPRLAAAVPEHETLARLGGDEFALVLAPGDEVTASAAGLRLRAALEPSFDVEGIAMHINASVGISLCPDHSVSALGLLRRADVAMYEAKRVRTGHEVYLPERDRHSRDRLGLIGQLHAAIEGGELVVHYQPKAEVPSGRVRAVEALVRWQHPERGLLGPAAFLPLAEQSGLTRALTAFVLDRALRDMREFAHDGEALAVAVNLGPADLLDLGLPSEVGTALERHRFPPHRLVLEVSEDHVMADPQRTLDVLDGLRAHGVGLSLDDFGAGQSSLAHLKVLRLDELKIDRSFLLEAGSSPEDAAIVGTTVALGRRLGLRVVAEGVASEGAWDLLVACGCDEAQGYLVSHPLPLDDLAHWLASRPARRFERRAPAADS